MLTTELPLQNKTLMQSLEDSKMNQRLFQMLPSILKELELKKPLLDWPLNNSFNTTQMLFLMLLFQMETSLPTQELPMETTLLDLLLAPSETTEMVPLEASKLTTGPTISHLPMVLVLIPPSSEASMNCSPSTSSPELMETT